MAQLAHQLEAAGGGKRGIDEDHVRPQAPRRRERGIGFAHDVHLVAARAAKLVERLRAARTGIRNQEGNGRTYKISA